MTEEVKQDKRMSKRFDVDFLAYFKGGSERIDGSVTQMSEGGAVFATGAHIAVRTAGQLHINVFQGEPDVLITGEVIYALRKGADGNAAYRYGIKFSAADKAMKETLSRIFMFVTVRDRYTVRPKGHDINGPTEIR